MSTAPFSVSLPESLGNFVITEARQRGFRTPDEYVQSVLQEEQQKSVAQLEAMLDEAVASGPAVEYTPERWQQKRQEILDRLGIRESP